MSTSTPLSFLVDTNVWMAYYTADKDLVGEAAQLLGAAARSHAELFCAPTVIKDIFYLLPRVLRQMDRERGIPELRSYKAAAWGCIESVMELATAAPEGYVECELARMLRGTHDDFEDNLLIAAAETANVDYIVTFDKGLRTHQPEICITPARALELLRMRGDISAQVDADAPFDLAE